MSAFKIKSNLDIGGNQLLNYCVGTYDDLTSVNRNTGYKLFYVPGDLENKWYRRELIFDGEDWHAAAYLDDLTSFKDEDFNKLKEKVDTLIGDGVDMDGIIESWKEVEAFLAGISDKKDLVTLLDDKVSKSEGGRVRGTFDIASTGYPNIRFFQNDNYWGSLGFNGQDNPAIRYGSASAWYTLLHSGNVGDYALKTDGSNAMTGDLQLLTMGSGTVNVAVTEGLFIYRGPSSGGTDVGLPDNYINVFNVGGANAYSNLQLAWRRDYPNPTLYARIGESTNYSDWKAVAFTDSDITGNAATATKLKNKVSLWGNEFDGTQSLSGNITVRNNNGLLGTKSDTTTVTPLVILNNQNIFYLGTDDLYNKDISTRIYGKTIDFRTSGTASMSITDGGRVLINRSSAILDRQLSIGNGGVYVSATLSSSPALGSVGSNSLLVGASTYGMQHWALGDGQGNIQVGRFDGTATAYALNLNPLGGAVNVGAGGLNVNSSIISTGSLSLGTEDVEGSIYLRRKTHNYLWASSEGGSISIGVQDIGGAGVATASLQILPYSLNPGTRNNAVSLGTSTYRWSDVYSVGGNFSGRVLIGGAEDDGESALQVNNKMSIGTSKTSFGLRFDRASFIAWIPDDYQYSHNMPFQLKKGDAVLGEFGHYIAHGEYIAYIGNNFVSPWFSINSNESNFKVPVNFGVGALIPTGQKLTIGDVNGDHATIEYDSIAKAIKVDGNLFTTGTNASGGKADAQQGGTGGNAEVYRHDLDWGEQVYKIQNVKGDVNVNVQVYEWNENGNSWDMILTDVSVTANIITVTFGRPTSVDHMVTVV